MRTAETRRLEEARPHLAEGWAAALAAWLWAGTATQVEVGVVTSLPDELRPRDDVTGALVRVLAAEDLKKKKIQIYFKN